MFDEMEVIMLLLLLKKNKLVRQSENTHGICIIQAYIVTLKGENSRKDHADRAKLVDTTKSQCNFHDQNKTCYKMIIH